MISLSDIVKFSPEFQKVLVAVFFSGIFWYIILYFAAPDFFHSESKEVVVIFTIGLSFCDLFFMALPNILFNPGHAKTDTEILKLAAFTSILISVLMLGNHFVIHLPEYVFTNPFEFNVRKVIYLKSFAFLGVLAYAVGNWIKAVISKNKPTDTY